MIEIIQGLPDNVVAVTASGKVTGEDYDSVLIPVIEEKLKKHDKIRVLYASRSGLLRLHCRGDVGRCQNRHTASDGI